MQKRLTDLMRHLSLQERIEHRRRIEAIADYWALKLWQKHGDGAKARCIKHQISTTKNKADLRNHIWCKVNRRLKLY